MRYAPPRLGQLTGVFALLLHLVVVGVLPFADRRHEAAAVPDVVHLDAEEGTDCSPTDGQLDCQFCRFLCRDVLAAAKSLAVLPVDAQRLLEEPVPTGPFRALGGWRTIQSRAPPLLV